MLRNFKKHFPWKCYVKFMIQLSIEAIFNIFCSNLRGVNSIKYHGPEYFWPLPSPHPNFLNTLVVFYSILEHMSASMLCIRLRANDFPVGPVAKTPHFQCRESKFDPGPGNLIPHAPTKSLLATTERSHAATKSWYSQKTIK